MSSPLSAISPAHTGRSPQMDYIRQADYEQVSEHVANYTQIREILEEMSEINHELLRRREPI